MTSMRTVQYCVPSYGQFASLVQTFAYPQVRKGLDFLGGGAALEEQKIDAEIFESSLGTEFSEYKIWENVENGSNIFCEAALYLPAGLEVQSFHHFQEDHVVPTNIMHAMDFRAVRRKTNQCFMAKLAELTASTKSEVEA